ncbi:hypothetical protein [Hyphomicrobium sp.]|jgi:hypothetical protein|uniref:hypothetical protein n=1 Tax=Hyphomicrobium sp. TaxID=82 RepID=UPI000FBA65D5|nr:hypothetical protein [Hyphomicrobium sp.]RUP00339.1 MAG: hypothetical protein EKK30_01905 [Hyphomicrobium sp.]
MKLASAATLVAIFAAIATPTYAAEDCDGGFKTHMGKMSIYIDKMSGYELADAVRKSLDAYNSCKAGDGFSPHGVWDQIEADMQAKHGK